MDPETTDTALTPLTNSVLNAPEFATQALPQLLNDLKVTRLPLGLMLFFGPTPKVRRVICDIRRKSPILT